MNSKISTRFFALIVDFIFYSIFSKILGTLIGRFLPMEIIPVVLLPGTVLLFAVYYVYPIQKTGQTLGKKILGIQIIFNNIEGPPTAWLIIKREVIGRIVSCFFMLGYLWAFFSPKKQTFHDLIANTEVITIEIESNDAPWLKWIPLAGLPALSSILAYIGLYTSAPLGALQTYLEKNGIKVAAISGTIMDGIRIENIAINNDNVNLELQSVALKMDVVGTLTKRKLIVIHAIAEDGFINKKSKPKDPLQPLVAQVPIPNIKKENEKSGALVVNLFRLKNIGFQKNGIPELSLQAFEIKSLLLNSQQASVEEIKLDSDKFNLVLQNINFDPAKKGFTLALLKGRFTPGLTKILKKDLSFELAAVDPSSETDLQKWEGKFGNADIKVALSSAGNNLVLSNLKASEFLTLDLPIENVQLNLKSKKGSPPDILAKVTVCNRLFTLNGPVFSHQQNNNQFFIKPDLNKTALAFNDGFDHNKKAAQYLPLELIPIASSTAPYASAIDSVGALCFNKKQEELTVPESAYASTIAGSVKLMVPAQQAEPMPAFIQTDSKEFQLNFETSKQLFKQGKTVDALKLVDNKAPPSTLSIEEQISYFRYMSWLHLYYGDPKKAAAIFGLIYRKQQNISDAEGALKAYEKAQDNENQKKWTAIIKIQLANNPSLKTKLTPSIQRSLASEQ